METGGRHAIVAMLRAAKTAIVKRSFRLVRRRFSAPDRAQCAPVLSCTRPWAPRNVGPRRNNVGWAGGRPKKSGDGRMTVMQRFFALISRVTFATASVVLAVVGNAAAADYPARQPHIIVGYPPGGSTDICARLFADWLSRRLGQQFIVENRPGAGNNLATDAVAKAAPDGYTILLVNPANTINASLYKHLNFNFLR